MPINSNPFTGDTLVFENGGTVSSTAGTPNYSRVNAVNNPTISTVTAFEINGNQAEYKYFNNIMSTNLVDYPTILTLSFTLSKGQIPKRANLEFLALIKDSNQKIPLKLGLDKTKTGYQDFIYQTSADSYVQINDVYIAAEGVLRLHVPTTALYTIDIHLDTHSRPVEGIYIYTNLIEKTTLSPTPVTLTIDAYRSYFKESGLSDFRHHP